MGDGFSYTALAFMFVIGLFSVGVWLGGSYVRSGAFERGHMVQCLGKSGYYWDCN